MVLGVSIKEKEPSEKQAIWEHTELFKETRDITSNYRNLGSFDRILRSPP